MKRLFTFFPFRRVFQVPLPILQVYISSEMKHTRDNVTIVTLELLHWTVSCVKSIIIE